MSDIKQKFNILATIDHLRARKARPDIDRICGYMLKKFKVSSKETKADLKRCLDSEAVYKVDYKGNVSYRNASKWKRELKSAVEISKTNAMKNNPSAEQRLIMTTAMAELIFLDQDYLRQGVPPHKLMKAISSKENLLHPKKYLESIIQKELETGGLIQMNNGNLALGPGDREQDSNAEIYNDNADSNTKLTSSNNSSSTSSPMRVKGKPGRKKGSSASKMSNASGSFVRSEMKRGAGIRVGERRKRAKKVFDPSDNNLPSKKKRGRPVGSLNKATIKKQHVNNSSPLLKDNMFRDKSKSESAESSDDLDNETNDSQSLILDTCDKVTGGVCSVCRQHNSIKDNSGKLVGCRDCSNKAHPSCLEGDGMLRLRPDNSWQCPHCKTCVICIETTDAGILTVCHVCADAYHALCHSPHISEEAKAWDQWECRNCQQTRNSSANIDSAYMEKLPSSDRSSKYSDRSDSRKSSLDRKLEKSSLKSNESDDKIEKSDAKLLIAEKDLSYSPISVDKTDWKYSRKLISPVMTSKHTWRHKKSNLNEKNSESDNFGNNQTSEEKSEKKTGMNSVFMDSHEFNKFYNSNSFKKHPHDKEDGTIDPCIPDAQKWTYHDVYQYFSSYFPEQAHVFKEQEIDGKSLLLMQRSDVIRSFGLPLGPALKMYRHVVKLQSRKNDFTMCWL